MAEAASSTGGLCLMARNKLATAVGHPKQEFGKVKPVKRAFQALWFNKWRCLIKTVPRTRFFVLPVFIAF